MSLLTDLRAQRNILDSQIQGICDAVEKRGEQLLTEAETEKVQQLRAQRAPIQERILELEAQEARDEAAAGFRRALGDVGPARISNEPRTYTEHTARSQNLSFFRDAFARSIGDPLAAERMARHARECVVDAAAEARAVSTGSFAGLVPPQYLVDAAALVLRQGRPTADVVNHMPLPGDGMVLNVPKGTTGASVASQTPENSAVSNTDEVWTNVTVPVVTIAGQQDISRQSVERGSNVDTLVFLDLAGAWAAELDRQVLNGSGASNQMLGILQTSGIYTGTAFGAAVTATNFYSHVGGGLQQVLSNRFLPPTHIVMSPRRYAWLLSQVDGSGRPLVVPGGGGNSAQNAQGVSEFGASEATGTLMGLHIVVDPNVPLNVGTNNEDVVIVFRATDCWLWGDETPTQLRFEQTLGNQLTIKAVLYSYSAFTAGRYPTAVAKFGGADATAGQGLIAPTLG